jgi:DNA-binding cell septation regulator SpoVG
MGAPAGAGRTPTPIEILEIRQIGGHGNLKAFVTVKLGCVKIFGCRIIQQPDQKPWVALPQVPARKRADGSGSGWFAVIEITNRDVLDQLRAAVLAAWEAGR